MGSNPTPSATPAPAREGIEHRLARQRLDFPDDLAAVVFGDRLQAGELRMTSPPMQNL